MKKPIVSVIIPIYNEEKDIRHCLDSVLNQSYANFEVIAVDDGSTDGSIDAIRKYPITLIKQSHRGPGSARNNGAKKAKGKILVFVDADQILEKQYIIKLITPILDNKAVGTVNGKEIVSNLDNVWSRCWNISQNMPLSPDSSRNEIFKEFDWFRAILKEDFLSVGGFDENTGYSDDRLGKKLGLTAYLVKDAIAYHKCPDNLREIFWHAVWIGKDTESRNRPLLNFLVHLFPISIVRGLLKSISSNTPHYLIFKVIFDFGLLCGIIKAVVYKDYSK